MLFIYYLVCIELLKKKKLLLLLQNCSSYRHNKQSIAEKLKTNELCLPRSGVGKLWPVAQMRPTKQNILAATCFLANNKLMQKKQV